jgi:4-amino-4-deoxy-L-arabinose transferase-like glycosyltransferase
LPLILLRYLALLFVLALSTYARTKSITINGINGTDTFIYWELVDLWSNGSYRLNSDPWGSTIHFYRPLFFLLNLVAIKFFGSVDYALRALIAVFETGNVLLVFAIGRLAKGYIVGLICAILYAVTPTSLIWSQSELANTYCETFALLSYLFYQLRFANNPARKTNKEVLILLSGFFAAASLLTHGSMLFYCLPLGILVVFSVYAENKREEGSMFREYFTTLGSFISGALLPMVGSIMFLGYEFSITAISGEANLHSKHHSGFSAFYHFIKESLTSNLSSEFFYLFILSTIISVALLGMRKNGYTESTKYLFIYLCFGYLFVGIFGGESNPRFILPMTSFAVLGTICTLASLCQWKIKLWSQLASVALAVAIGWTTFYNRYGTFLALYQGREVGIVKGLYTSLKDQVDEDNKILIAPYIVRSWPKRFDALPYFSSNAVYLFDCQEETFQSYLTKHKVKFVFLAPEDFWNKPMLRYSMAQTGHVGSCMGKSRDDYQVEDELIQLKSWLSVNGNPIKNDYGELFSLENY